jgi:hypothetical protein
MRDFERRIKVIEKELKTGEDDGSAWWEDFKKRDPAWAEFHEQFFEMHKDDPDFVKELAERKFSDKTINEYADGLLERVRECREDPKYASMFRKRVNPGYDGRQEDSNGQRA